MMFIKHFLLFRKIKVSETSLYNLVWLLVAIQHCFINEFSLNSEFNEYNFEELVVL